MSESMVRFQALVFGYGFWTVVSDFLFWTASIWFWLLNSSVRFWILDSLLSDFGFCSLWSVFIHQCPILDESDRFQTLESFFSDHSDFRHYRQCPILDTSVRFWTLVPDFRYQCPILDTSVRFWTPASYFRDSDLRPWIQRTYQFFLSDFNCSD